MENEGKALTNILGHQFLTMTRCQIMETIGGQKEESHKSKLKHKQFKAMNYL